MFEDWVSLPHFSQTHHVLEHGFTHFRRKHDERVEVDGWSDELGLLHFG